MVYYFAGCVWHFVEQFSSQGLCGGSEQTFNFQTSGNFQANNTFKVQISENYGPFTDLPGSFTASPATVRLPEGGKPNTTYRIRIAASNPEVYSYETSSFSLNRLPTAELVGHNAGSNAVNPYSTVSLKVNFTGGYPYTIQFSDSSRFTKTSDYYYDGNFMVKPSATTTYTIASVQNACGKGTASGSTTIRVNKIGFMVTGVSPAYLCTGGKLTVNYSSNGPLPDDTRFAVEFISMVDNSSISVSVQGTTSPIEVVVPASLLLGTYRVKLMSPNARVEAMFSENSAYSSITIGRPASIRLFGASEIRFGQTAKLETEIYGDTPINVVFADGYDIRYAVWVNAVVSATSHSPFDLAGWQQCRTI